MTDKAIMNVFREMALDKQDPRSCKKCGKPFVDKRGNCQWCGELNENV